MAESSGWNNRSAASQRSGFMSSMAHARAYDHGATLPVHSNSEYSHMGFYSRRMQNGETFSGGHSRSRSMQAVNTPESANGAGCELINEEALVIDIHRQYGRILSPTNVRRPNLHIFFSLQTLNGTEPLSAITDDLSELFEVGDQVEIGVERAKVMNGAASECQLIIECSNILQIPDEFERPQLEPLLMVQEGGEMPFAVTKQCGLVGVHPQVLPDQKIINAFLENNMQVFFPQMEWPEFAMIGHSVEGRVIRAPRWFSQAWNETQDIEKVALTLQRFGRDVAGFAIVKGHLENGVILLPIDKDDLKECGEIFFPFEIKRAESDFDYTKIYRIGSKWYFRACPELPGRRFHYRAYCLDDLNGTMPRHSEPSSSQTAVERSSDQAQQSVVDRSSGTRSCQLSMNNASLWEDSANNNVDTTIHLVDIGTPETSILQPTSASVNQPQQQPSPKPVVSESTLDLLSEVDFTAPSNLLDINEPYLSAEPLVPIRSTQTSSFGSRAQSTTIGDNKNAANTMNNSTMTTSNSQQNVDKTPLESAATADSESFASLSGFCLVHTIPTESYSKPCPSNLASSKQQQQPSSTHDSLSLSDGETLVLISTPPSSVKISDVNTTQNEKNINNTQQRLDIVQSAALTNSTLSSNANEFDDTLTSDSLPQLQLCKKYDVFDEEKASKMYFEVISKPKQTLEEELIGGFEDEHEHYFDTSETIQHQFGSVVSHDGTRTSPTTKNVPNGKSDADIVAPTLKTSSKAVDSDQSKSTSTTEESQGDVHFVKTNESLAEVLHRLTAAGDHPQNSSQPRLSKSSEQIEGESSDYDVDDDTVRCNSERSLYAIRVPRRADDNEFWFTSKSGRQPLTCKQSVTQSHSQSSVVSSNDGKYGEIAENNDNHGHKVVNKNRISDPVVSNNSTEDSVDASKVDRGTQYNAISQEQTASPSLKTVLRSDDIFAKFFTDVVKQQPQ